MITTKLFSEMSEAGGETMERKLDKHYEGTWLQKVDEWLLKAIVTSAAAYFMLIFYTQAFPVR